MNIYNRYEMGNYGISRYDSDSNSIDLSGIGFEVEHPGMWLPTVPSVPKVMISSNYGIVNLGTRVITIYKGTVIANKDHIGTLKNFTMSLNTRVITIRVLYNNVYETFIHTLTQQEFDKVIDYICRWLVSSDAALIRQE